MNLGRESRFAKGGQELPIDVVNSEVLRAARKNPETYQDRVVPVAGFSEFFARLTPEMQDEIIIRIEHHQVTTSTP